MLSTCAVCGKHVHYACRAQPEALRVHQHARVARQRGGVAGDVDDAARPFLRQPLDELDRALARGVDEHFLEGAERGDALLEEVGDLELRDHGVGGGILAGALDQLAAAFEADHLRAAPGEGQREVAQAAEEVGDALAGRRIEQPHGARHQDPVHAMVDLGEIGGAESDAHAELRQVVVQLAARGVERLRAVRAPWAGATRGCLSPAQTPAGMRGQPP